MVDKKKTRSDCAISQSLDIFGDKWSFLIIRDLAFLDKNTYGDLLKMEESIATNILADRLATLEKAEIITKEIFVGSKSKFKYKLTKKGIDTIPIIVELIIWGAKYGHVFPEQKEFLKFNIEKKESYIRDVMQKHATGSAS